MRFFSVLEADIKLLACQKTMEYEKPVELWANYPQDCDAFNPLVSDAEACNSRFRELSSVLFNDEKFDVRLISLAGNCPLYERSFVKYWSLTSNSEISGLETIILS